MKELEDLEARKGMAAPQEDQQNQLTWTPGGSQETEALTTEHIHGLE